MNALLTDAEMAQYVTTLSPHGIIQPSSRPQAEGEKRAVWYGRAALTGFPLMLGPRFQAEFERQFAREYEAEQITDSAPSVGDLP